MSSAEKPNAENAAQDNDSKLLAEAFGADARVLQAKALLADAARDHRGQITGPRPANPELARVQRADLEVASAAVPWWSWPTAASSST